MRAVLLILLILNGLLLPLSAFAGLALVTFVLLLRAYRRTRAVPAAR